MNVSVDGERGKIPLKSDGKASERSYLSEVKDELKKITWPQSEELRTCTKVVVTSVFCFGIGIYMADLAIKGVLDGFFLLFRALFG